MGKRKLLPGIEVVYDEDGLLFYCDDEPIEDMEFSWEDMADSELVAEVAEELAEFVEADDEADINPGRTVLTRLKKLLREHDDADVEEEPEEDRLYDDLDEALDGVDAVMMLRVQRERLEGLDVPDNEAYHHDWGLTPDRLEQAAPDCIVMHPGPMNRGVEISPEVADGPRSVILEQVRNGVAVRMAILAALAG